MDGLWDAEIALRFFDQFVEQLFAVLIWFLAGLGCLGIPFCSYLYLRRPPPVPINGRTAWLQSLASLNRFQKFHQYLGTSGKESQHNASDPR